MLSTNDNTSNRDHRVDVDRHFQNLNIKNKSKKSFIGRSKGILTKVEIVIFGDGSSFFALKGVI